MLLIDDSNNAIDVMSNKVINVANPTIHGDAVNLAYFNANQDQTSHIIAQNLNSASYSELTFAQ